MPSACSRGFAKLLGLPWDTGKLLAHSHLDAHQDPQGFSCRFALLLGAPSEPWCLQPFLPRARTLSFPVLNSRRFLAAQKYVVRGSRDISHPPCPHTECLEPHLSNKPCGNLLPFSSDSLLSPSLSPRQSWQ